MSAAAESSNTMFMSGYERESFPKNLRRGSLPKTRGGSSITASAHSGRRDRAAAHAPEQSTLTRASGRDARSAARIGAMDSASEKPSGSVTKMELLRGRLSSPMRRKE